LGAEKVAVSSAAIYNMPVLKEIGKAVGVQSVVVVLDVRKKLFGGYELVTHNGKKAAPVKLLDLIAQISEIGIGEIVINSVDQDGKMKGFDYKIFDLIREQTDMPMTILGGAGSIQDIHDAISRYGTIGVSAGSLFVFKGKYRAVLINYPTLD